MSEKQQELDKQAELIKMLESQCRELGERNNNMNEESINWRKKYSILREETERLNGMKFVIVICSFIFSTMFV